MRPHTKKKKFSDAQKDCQKDGASLVQMPTKDENDLMAKTLAKSKIQLAWMDLTLGKCSSLQC